MKKIVLSLFTFLIISFSLQAQFTGFGGKYCLLKVNAVSGTYGFFNGLQAEFLVQRNITLGVGFDFINADVKQSYQRGTVTETLGITESYEKANVSYYGYNIEFRKYFSDIPAPDGFYFRAAYSRGNLDIVKGGYGLRDVYYNTNIISYSLSGIDLSILSGGFGYQKAFNKWLFIGGYLSIDRTSFGTVMDGLPDIIFSGVARNFGSNFGALSSFSKNDEPSKTNTGFSGVLQIGFLIY